MFSLLSDYLCAFSFLVVSQVGLHALSMDCIPDTGDQMSLCKQLTALLMCSLSERTIRASFLWESSTHLFSHRTGKLISQTPTHSLSLSDVRIDSVHDTRKQGHMLASSCSFCA